MKRILHLTLGVVALLLTSQQMVQAGNPDRQGEAGAYELLMNPWARSAGLHTLNTSFVSGVEAMRLNIAGLSRIQKTEINFGYADYLSGAGVDMIAAGIAQSLGDDGNSAFGISLMALDFGDIPVTTTELPEGTGATFSPSWFNIGLGYAHTFENKVSVGILLRGVFESTAEISASGFALDAGVQYVTGPEDNFKLGVSLRNIGTRMKFGGEALSDQLTTDVNDDDGELGLTFRVRTADFELPSVLNIGLSYDFVITDKTKITILGNFAANSFSRDQLGGGIEFVFNELFAVRGAYKVEVGSTVQDEDLIGDPIYTGAAFGATIWAPLSKKNKNNKLGIDYSWRDTSPFDGTHNVGVRIEI